MEEWNARELELSKRHEEIILRREALLRGTETYYNRQEQQAETFLVDYAKAKERNEELLEHLYRCRQDLAVDLKEEGTSRFNALKNNYWSMVRSVFPVWLEEQKEYERRHGTLTVDNRASPRPPSSARNLGSSRELMSTDTLETVPQLEDFDAVDAATLPHTPRPPSSRGGSLTPRSGRKTPTTQKRVSYPGEDDMESTLIYDTEDAPSLSTGGGGGSSLKKKHAKGKGKGKGKKSKDKSNKAEQKRK